MLIQSIYIATGGAIGALMRFYTSSWVNAWMGRDFPYGTLTVNLLGSLLIGFLSELVIQQRVVIPVELRGAILVGVLGAFTTFSTFSLETIGLIEQGEVFKALLNVFISVFCCLLATGFGLLCARSIFN